MNTVKLQFTKKDDIVSKEYNQWGIDMGDLQGTWKNANERTGQFSRIKFSLNATQTLIQCFGKLDRGEQDWGTSDCELFSSNASSNEIEGFVSYYDFDFMEIKIVGNVKYGTMVIQSYNTFKDGSNRNNYFAREFFVKEIKKI
jgi:hypothetical protein